MLLPIDRTARSGRSSQGGPDDGQHAALDAHKRELAASALTLTIADVLPVLITTDLDIDTSSHDPQGSEHIVALPDAPVWTTPDPALTTPYAIAIQFDRPRRGTKQLLPDLERTFDFVQSFDRVTVTQAIVSVLRRFTS